MIVAGYEQGLSMAYDPDEWDIAHEANASTHKVLHYIDGKFWERLDLKTVTIPEFIEGQARGTMRLASGGGVLRRLGPGKDFTKISERAWTKAALMITLTQQGKGTFLATGRGSVRILRFTYYDKFYKKPVTVSCRCTYNEKTDGYTFEACGVKSGETYHH
jgi:hypothetical protein